MPADLTATLSVVGAPTGNLTLATAEKSVEFTTSGRTLAYAELAADDAAFLWRYVTGDTAKTGRVPAGGSLKVPVNSSLTVYVLEDPDFAEANLRTACCG